MTVTAAMAPAPALLSVFTLAFAFAAMGARANSLSPSSSDSISVLRERATDFGPIDRFERPKLLEARGDTLTRMQRRQLREKIMSQPSPCVWAALACCAPTNFHFRFGCFPYLGCSALFWQTDPCHLQTVLQAVREASDFYEQFDKRPATSTTPTTPPPSHEITTTTSKTPPPTTTATTTMTPPPPPAATTNTTNTAAPSAESAQPETTTADSAAAPS